MVPGRCRFLELAALVGLAFSLRPVISSLGAVIGALSRDLGIGPTAVGLLLTLPTLALAGWGLLAPSLAAVAGLHRLILGCAVVISAGCVLRAVGDSGVFFFVATGIALSAAAVGNVFLPVLTVRHFPDRLETVSAVVVTSVLTGAAAGAIVTPWLVHVLGGWRGPLMFWGLLVIPVALLWMPLAARGERQRGRSRPAGGMRAVARSGAAWVLAAFFGLQLMHGFVMLGWVPVMLADHGAAASVGGLTVGLFSLAAIPLSIVVPRMVARHPRSPVLPVTFALAASVGWFGLAVAPIGAPLLWGGLVGLGAGIYPWTMTVIADRTQQADGAADLSGFVQTVGYGLAAVGPAGVGLLRDAGVEWPVVCGLLAVSGVTCAVLAMGVVGRLSRTRVLTTV